LRILPWYKLTGEAFQIGGSDENIDTSKLIKTTSKLSSIRNILQNELISNFVYDKPISIVHAPTGIGKPKVFLDLLINYKSRNENVERIFYFSPLPVLTKDFENKFSGTI
jgi:hypothetical protein